MQTQIKKLENLTWINITKPEIFALKNLLRENDLNENLANDFIEPTLDTRTDTMRNAIYTTFHFPFSIDGNIKNLEVDFLLKSNLLITSAYEDFPDLKKHIENLSTNPYFHGGLYFLNFLNSKYIEYLKDLKKFDEQITEIEKNIYNTEERLNIINIASLSRNIFDFKKSLKLHKSVYENLEKDSVQIFGFEFIPQLKVVIQKYDEIMNILQNQTENISELKEVLEFLLTNKTNQIVKVFTVVSFVILPMTFIASFFGMNTKFPNDLVLSQFGTIYIMVFMFLISLLVLLYLHFKKLI